MPVIAAPIADPKAVGAPGGLPIGVQLIAAPWREDLLFRIAAALENAGACACPEPPR
jgi:amidase/aspartyl-tRNA(Asn)/glutamyl-tRNA(Gln) amidotransferase subunit A